MTKKILLPLLLIVGLSIVGYKLYKKTVAPTFTYATDTLRNLKDNSVFKIADFKEKVLIVAYFKSWCTDCARETPSLEQLVANINNKNFTIICVSDETVDKINGFKNRFAPSDNLIFCKSEKLFEENGIVVFPTTYLLDKNGAVVLSKLEGYDWLKEMERIKKLLQ
jgi:peroxiredoxin